MRNLSNDGNKVLRVIRDELTETHIIYGQFKILYLGKQETLQLLDRVATYFFGMIRDMMFRDIMLSLSRLCDPARTGRFLNLTFETIAAELPPKLQARYLAKLAKLRTRVKKVRYWRDKGLAHNSLPHGLKHENMPRIGYHKLASYLEDASELYNIVARYNGEKVNTIFTMSVAPRSAANLLGYLEDSVKRLDEKYKGTARTL